MNRLQMAVQLALISLVLSLTACGGADKALAERAGYYKATNVVQNGEELDLNNFFDMGPGFFLVLNEDGSGYLDMMEEKTPLTWDKSNITAGDGEDKDEQAYSYDNGTKRDYADNAAAQLDTIFGVSDGKRGLFQFGPTREEKRQIEAGARMAGMLGSVIKGAVTGDVDEEKLAQQFNDAGAAADAANTGGLSKYTQAADAAEAQV